MTENNSSSTHIAMVRILLGSYLAVHFIQLIPYAAEVFSRVGLAPDSAAMPTAAIFPNLLSLIDTPIGVSLFCGTLAVIALLFTVNFGRRWMALLLWYGWACLFNRNLFIGNPSIPYIGWMLLAFAAIPKTDQMPRLLYWGGWALLALGYTASGLHKMGAPSWLDGSALRHVLETPLARPNGLRAALLGLPEIGLRILTWATLAVEVLFVPLAMWRRTRFWVWLAMVSMHVGIMGTVDFVDLTLGMLLMHAFVFEPRWLRLPSRDCHLPAPHFSASMGA